MDYVVTALLGFMVSGLFLWWMVKNHAGKTPEEFIAEAGLNLPVNVVVCLAAMPAALVVMPVLYIQRFVRNRIWQAEPRRL